MKSTGLFGKNSGKLGGVVYSNYRGEQIVRTYQPKVKNPDSEKQREQRAKFKLVSQVAAALGSQLKLSFVASKANETPRNSFVREMLKKTTFANNVASLPIEELVVTSSSENWIVSVDQLSAQGVVSGTLSERFLNDVNLRVRAVFVGYNEGGELTLIDVKDAIPTINQGSLTFSVASPRTAPYSSKRVLLYAYRYTGTDVSFEDYEMNDDVAVLDVLPRTILSGLEFSATVNRELLENV